MSYPVRLVLVLFIFCHTLSFLEAISEVTARESPCLNITNAVDPDPTWFSSVDRWYYPLASRLDLYRSVHDLLGIDYNDIPEYSVYYDSCLTWGINSNGFTLYGFNGKSRFLRTTPVGQGVADFKSEWKNGMVGRAYTTLTDNKTFAFTAACFADNQMSWNVFATTPTLDEPTKNLIFEHAKSLGYQAEYFTEMRYETCAKKSTIPDKEYQSMVEDERENNVHFNSNSNRTEGIKPRIPWVCNACQRVCPGLAAKNKFWRKYYKTRSKQ